MRASSWRLPARLREQMEEFAVSAGWEPCGYADDEGRFLWFRKRLYASYYAVLSIGLASRDVVAGMQLHASISAAFVENASGGAQFGCFRGYSVEVGRARYIDLLRVSVAWLLARWSPTFGSFLDVQKLLLIRSDEDAPEEAARAKFALLSTRAQDFINHIDSQDKLAACLLDLSNFPGQGMGAGPHSAAPKLMAAGILMDLDKRHLAMSIIDDAISETERLRRNQELDESDAIEARRIANCLRNCD